MSGWLILYLPAFLMSAGTLSSAITATAPESSATAACSGSTTSMMTSLLYSSKTFQKVASSTEFVEV